MVWFSLLVLMPLSAIVVKALGGGWSTFEHVLTNEQTRSALQLTVLSALGITAINMVMGTMIAWVLVRDQFAGKRVLDLVIDIPFAMPTIVAGLVLLSLYGPGSPIGVHVNNTRWAVFLAMAFVTLPFVVRTVQPVLEELDTDVEDAAASLGASRFTTFRRVTLPALVPAMFAGGSRVRPARAIVRKMPPAPIAVMPMPARRAMTTRTSSVPAVSSMNGNKACRRADATASP